MVESPNNSTSSVFMPKRITVTAMRAGRATRKGKREESLGRVTKSGKWQSSSLIGRHYSSERCSLLIGCPYSLPCSCPGPVRHALQNDWETDGQKSRNVLMGALLAPDPL